MPSPSKRPTVRDIAAETGLSPAAVSYALRGLHVPPETQARVREAAERLGYQANPIARALAGGRSGLVGVLCASLEDVWQQAFAAALGRELIGVERSALILDATNDPEHEAAMATFLADRRVDAIVTLPVDPSSAHWAAIAEQTVLVSVGDGLPDAGTATELVFDNVAGVTRALTLLAEAGHRRVAVLTPNRRSTPDRPAEEVVLRVAPELGLRAQLVTCPYDLEGAAEVAHAVLTGDDPPTGVFALADSMAYGVYDAARSLGLRIPDDVSVLGYDDHPMSRLLTPALSTFQWPVAEMVSTLTTRVVRAVEEGKKSRLKRYTPQPRPRGSLAPPRSP